MHRRAPKKPVANRFFLLVVVSLVTSAQRARATEPLDENDVLRAALGRPGVAASLDARVEAERADALVAPRIPNPVVAYQREQILTPTREHEEALTVSQQLDVSGSFVLRAEAADARADGLGLTAEAARRKITAEARRRLYGLVYRQERHDAVAAWLARLGVAERHMRLRKESGDVSAYALRRIEREVRRARAELARAQAERERAWQQLLAITGKLEAPRGWPRVQGRLLPAAPPRKGLEASAPLRPEVRALDHAISAAELEQEAAARAWVPQLGLMGGWRSIVLADRRYHGFVAGVSLSLPLFDHGQAAAARAEARAKEARAERELLLSETTALVRAAHAAASRHHSAATTFRAEALPAGKDLVRLAEEAYGAGELRLLELLDAHRAMTDDQLEALELDRAARMARIDLDMLTTGAP